MRTLRKLSQNELRHYKPLMMIWGHSPKHCRQRAALHVKNFEQRVDGYQSDPTVTYGVKVRFFQKKSI